MFIKIKYKHKINLKITKLIKILTNSKQIH